MACVNSDGTITSSARAVLKATQQPVTAAEIAAATGLPLYRIRGSLRELVDAGLLTLTDEQYQVTESAASHLT
jgi:DNA-binding IclR family transcriptional regulator